MTQRVKKAVLALLASAALVSSVTGCGEVASHAPQIISGLGIGVGGAMLYEHVQDARAAGYRADQESIRLNTMQRSFSSAR